MNLESESKLPRSLKEHLTFITQDTKAKTRAIYLENKKTFYQTIKKMLVDRAHHGYNHLDFVIDIGKGFPCYADINELAKARYFFHGGDAQSMVAEICIEEGLDYQIDAVAGYRDVVIVSIKWP